MMLCLFADPDARRFSANNRQTKHHDTHFGATSLELPHHERDECRYRNVLFLLDLPLVSERAVAARI